jgi:arginase
MQREIGVVGAPVDFGANRRGVDMGPSAIRYAGLDERLSSMGLSCTDRGDIMVNERHPPADDGLGLESMGRVATKLSGAVDHVLSNDGVPLVLGGDHSISIGTMQGLAGHRETGLLWFDAHADLNTPETSPSGNTHGMPVAAGLGFGSFAERDWADVPGLSEDNIVYIGLRSVDPAEKERIHDSEITAYTMVDIDDRGIRSVMEEALGVATAGTDGLHVSLDMDWLDPGVAPGVGTPVRGGVSYREAHRAMELVAEEDDLAAMEVVEVNPVLDESNTTAEMAVDLVASAFGETVL